METPSSKVGAMTLAGVILGLIRWAAATRGFDIPGPVEELVLAAIVLVVGYVTQELNPPESLVEDIVEDFARELRQLDSSSSGH